MSPRIDNNTEWLLVTNFWRLNSSLLLYCQVLHNLNSIYLRLWTLDNHLYRIHNRLCYDYFRRKIRCIVLCRVSQSVMRITWEASNSYNTALLIHVQFCFSAKWWTFGNYFISGTCMRWNTAWMPAITTSSFINQIRAPLVDEVWPLQKLLVEWCSFMSKSTVKSNF